MNWRPALACLILLMTPVFAQDDNSEQPSPLVTNAFLRPYIDVLEKETPKDQLARIGSMSRDDLISLHQNYGMWIRNKWMHANADAPLMKFFYVNGVRHRDDASMILIEALWFDLNAQMSAEDLKNAAAKRATVKAKQVAYERLEKECATQLAEAKHDFAQCYQIHGRPSKNPVNENPFFQLTVDQTGKVEAIWFFEGAPDDLKLCLEKRLRRFRFSQFSTDPSLHVYIEEFPYCRVKERDRLLK
ncbi:MAG: hypothetical protein JO317_05930 [Verrucomicrobiae bacterium]|nr:hypothetical protein [Verrucomicrobiae bacterium]